MKGGVAILDFGSQYTQLIARRIRGHRVFSRIYPCSAPEQEVLAQEPDGMILSGGPSSVSAQDAPTLPGYVLQSGLPVLGICYGMQLLARAGGGRVEQGGGGEYGFTMLEVRGGRLFEGTPGRQQVWMSHGDKVTDPGPGRRIVASSEDCRVAAFEGEEGRVFGVQFHPEVVHTTYGERIIANFIFTICRCRRDWAPKNIVAEMEKQIAERVGSERVVCAVSGGVDSTVTACLVDRAVGGSLVAVFVDNGLLRAGEREMVERLLRPRLQGTLVVVDASRRFLGRLQGVTDPEEKRMRIGRLFIKIFEEVSRERGPFRYLAQGTLYPDRIESLSTFGPSATIKTHHNVGALPEKMGFELIEPLGLLFKDEVREIGLALGLPRDQIIRHPFPGPGLAVRVLGEVTEDKLEIVRQADALFIDALKEWGLYEKIWQAGAILLPVQTVGVMGDARTYEYAVVLRAVTSSDGMTADWADLGRPFLKEVSNRIINRVKGINRVVYDISSKPPSTIEWE